MGQLFAVGRILAQKKWCAGLVNIGDRRLRIPKRLAQSDQAVVGMDEHPYEIAKFLRLKRFDADDLHRASLPRLTS